MRETRYWLNRTLCDVLEDMRRCDTTKNYAALSSLIEEAQTMGNRMESGLGDQRDIVKMQEEWHKLNKEIKKLRKKRDGLKEKKK